MKLAVERACPSSGKPAELLAAAGIDAEQIAEAAKRARAARAPVACSGSPIRRNQSRLA